MGKDYNDGEPMKINWKDMLVVFFVSAIVVGTAILLGTWIAG